MWAEYLYTCTLDADGNGYSCDIAQVPVSIIRGTETFRTFGFIDSGCDATLVSYEIAEFLELDFSSTPSRFIRGLGGIAEGKSARIRMRIDDLGEPFETDVIFIKELKIPLALGQCPFFEKFDVRFEKNRNKFFLKRVS